MKTSCCEFKKQQKTLNPISATTIIVKAPIKIWKPWQGSQTLMPLVTWQRIYKSEANGFKGTSSCFVLFCFVWGLGAPWPAGMGKPLLSSSQPTTVCRNRPHVAYFKTGQMLWTATWNSPIFKFRFNFSKTLYKQTIHVYRQNPPNCQPCLYPNAIASHVGNWPPSLLLINTNGPW